MKIEAVQYNVIYTLNKNKEILIRQFCKHDNPDLEDNVIWYENLGGGNLVQITDSEKIKELEKEFLDLLQ